MNDTTTAAGNPAGAAPPDLSPAQIASARATWVAAGHDPGRFDAAMGVAPADPGSPAVPAPAAPGTGMDPLTGGQAETLAASLAALGKSEAEIEAEMAAHGMEPDQRTPEQIEHDREWGFDQHYEPGDYRINYQDTSLARTYTTDQLAASQAEWGALLAGMQIAPMIGGSLVEHVIRIGQGLAARTPAERGLWAAEQRYRATCSAGGPERLAERVRLAEVALKVAQANGASADTIDAMRRSGVLDDAFTLATLANHGRALEGWLAGPKKAAP